MREIVELFDTRLNTLGLLVQQGSSYFGDDGFLALRLVDDMLPLGTQIAFTCNQPHNFTQWIQGQEVRNLDPELENVGEATRLVSTTRTALSSIDVENTTLPEGKRLDFGLGRYAELSGEEYVNDFLVPNFYFHLVTTYDILRANGVQIGKADYMAHLLGRVREGADA
ncbi:MAG: DUF1993 family protein [Gemmatimonadales bacterium]